VVTDVGSVKYPIVTALSDALAGKARFVGSHPMAGSEQSGIEAARRDLFDNAVCIVTPREDTDKAALQLVYDFWKALGCTVKTLAPLEHDELSPASAICRILSPRRWSTWCAATGRIR
jgi:cyclohexadieny/prephenate dehydrogenase